MDYTHKPSGRFVLGVLAVTISSVLLWVISSLLFTAFFQYQQKNQMQSEAEKNRLLAEQEKAHILKLITSELPRPTEKEKVQIINSLTAKNSPKKSSAQSSSPPKPSTSEEKQKLIQSLPI